MCRKKIKYSGKVNVAKLEVIREVDKKERSRSDITEVHRLTLSTLSVYLNNQNSTEQALHGGDLSQQI
jgi:hypothetical protein